MKHLVIGPVDEDLLIDFFDEDFIRVEITTLEELAIAGGIFKSKGEARKNNFSGPIPIGVNCLGTKKKKVWVWRHP